MNQNEDKRYCPKCGAEYYENHLIVIDGPRQKYQMICTACRYKNEVPMGNKTIKDLIIEVSRPWKPKEN